MPSRAETFLKLVGGAIRGYLRWQKKPKNIAGAVFLFYGLPGFLDDTNWWVELARSAWEWVITQASKINISLPTANWERVMEALSADWTRWAALFLALLLFNFHRIRLVGVSVARAGGVMTKLMARKTQIVMQEAIHQEVLLTNEEALKAVRNSDWGRYMKKRGEEPRNRFTEAFESLNTMMTNPKQEAAAILFNAWLKRVLTRYERLYGDAVSTVDGQKRYKKAELETYLDDRFEALIVDNVGPVD